MPDAFFGQNWPVKKGKSEQHHWLLYIGTSLDTKFWLKLMILICWANLPKRGISLLKTEKVNFITEFCTFELVQVTNISLNIQFWFLGQICLNMIFLVENRKCKLQYWILHTRISLGNKFLLKHKILIFGPNMPKRGIFDLKQTQSEHHHWLWHIKGSQSTKF